MWRDLCGSSGRRRVLKLLLLRRGFLLLAGGHRVIIGVLLRLDLGQLLGQPRVDIVRQLIVRQLPNTAIVGDTDAVILKLQNLHIGVRLPILRGPVFGSTKKANCQHCCQCNNPTHKNALH